MRPYRYIFLLKQLVQRDLSQRYRGSALGTFWAIIAPLIMLAVYYFVFSTVFQARWGNLATGDESNFALNLFTGIILHGLLGETLSRSPSIIHQHSNFVKKIIFPLPLLPVVLVCSAFVFTLISCVILMLAYTLIEGPPPVSALGIPFILLPLLLYALGGAWFFSALGVYIKDVSQVMPLLTTILMFMAPIFYPATAIPENWRSWLNLNPLTYPVETARAMLFTGQWPAADAYLHYFITAIICAVVGLYFFKKVQKGFADVL